MLGTEIGVDLGTSSILIYLKGKGIVLQEPSVVAIDTRKNKVIAIGNNAKRMFEKVPPYIDIIYPLKDGIISDYKVTEVMLKYFISKAISRSSIRKPKVVVCAPCRITEVEKKAVRDAVFDAGAREVFLIEEPIAAAIGMGIDISKSKGRMVIDIGAGTTDIAVISLGSTVVGTSIKMAGNRFDEHIVNYLRKKYNILIGIKTAENLKKEIGSACNLKEPYEMDIKGQSVINALPVTIKVNSNEIAEALKEPINFILNELYIVFENTPPELSSDIFDAGIIMTGGGSLLYMLDKFIEKKTGVKTHIAKDVFNSVALGAGRYIKYNYTHLNKFNKKLRYLRR